MNTNAMHKPLLGQKGWGGAETPPPTMQRLVGMPTATSKGMCKSPTATKLCNWGHVYHPYACTGDVMSIQPVLG